METGYLGKSCERMLTKTGAFPDMDTCILLSAQLVLPVILFFYMKLETPCIYACKVGVVGGTLEAWIHRIASTTIRIVWPD